MAVLTRRCGELNATLRSIRLHRLSSFAGQLRPSLQALLLLRPWHPQARWLHPQARRLRPGARRLRPRARRLRPGARRLLTQPPPCGRRLEPA